MRTTMMERVKVAAEQKMDHLWSFMLELLPELVFLCDDW